MKRKLTIGGLVLLILVLSIAGSAVLIGSKSKPQRDGQREQLLTVKTADAEYSGLTTSFSYQGRVEALEYVSLAAEVTGKILEGDVPLKQGQNFSKGDLILKIYNKDAEASMKASRSNFLRTLANILPDMMVDFPDTYKTWRDFFNTIDIEKPLPDIPAAGQEKVKIFLASKNVLSEFYALKQQEIRFEKYNVYAPFDGYFRQVSKEAGSIAAGGMDLGVIVRSDRLEIGVPVLPADAERIEPGSTAEIRKRSGAEYSGRVSRVAQFVDASTQSVNVYITFKQTKAGPLLEGEFVLASFTSPEPVYGMRIPREALVENNQVYIVQDSMLKKAATEVVQVLEDYAVIRGLPEGTAVVTESLANVREGQRVLVRQDRENNR